MSAALRLGAFGGAAVAVGAGLTALAARFDEDGPLVALALALAPVLALAALAAPPLGVVAAFATFPLTSPQLPTGLGSLQAVEAAALAVACLVVLRCLALGRLPAWPPPLWFALGLAVWLVVGLPSAIAPDLAVKQIVALSTGIAFAVAVVAACPRMEDVRLVLGGFVAAVAVLALIALSAGLELEAAFGGTTVSGRLRGTFDHPNELGTVSALAAPVAAGLVLGARTRLGRLAALAGLALTLTSLLLSLTRGAWIGAGLAFLLVLVTSREAQRASVLLGVPLLATAGLAVSFAGSTPAVQVIGERAQSLAILSPYDDRPAIWAEAWREVQDDPLTGQGAGSFPVASARAASEASSVFAEHAHSLALTWAAESGPPALLLIAGFAVALGVSASRASRSARTQGRRRDRLLVLSIAGSLLALLGQGLFDYTLRNAVVWTATWTLVGALLAARRALEAESSRARPARGG